jgi:nucleotide-binding universal stress UspA family protein
MMTKQPIVVGVDTSEAAAGAARFASRLAMGTGTRCQLVHAAAEPGMALAAAQLPFPIDELKQALVDDARREVTRALGDRVSHHEIDSLLLRFGPPPVVLADVVREIGAGVVVLGGKHHSALGRWLGGSTCHNTVRTLPIPVLITRGEAELPRRVMAAVDLSAAARPTLETAERYAALFGAKLRVLTVLESLPVVTLTPEVPVPNLGDYYGLLEEQLRRDVWSRVRYPGAETVVRHGTTLDTLLREATEWQADLLVVGSHGKNWAERVLIGSVTERLLNHLPTSLLVVPVLQPEVVVVEPVRRHQAVLSTAVV